MGNRLPAGHVPTAESPRQRSCLVPLSAGIAVVLLAGALWLALRLLGLSARSPVAISSCPAASLYAVVLSDGGRGTIRIGGTDGLSGAVALDANDVRDLRFSPSGAHLAFVASFGTSTAAYLVDLAAGGQPELFAPAALVPERTPYTEPLAVAWLDDQRLVLACYDGLGKLGLFVYNVATREAQLPVKDLEADDVTLFGAPLASPPCVFVTLFGPAGDLVQRLNVETGQLEPAVSPYDQGWGLPSPDGTRLLLNEYGSTEYRVVPVLGVGSGPMLQVEAQNWAGCADWSPSGERFALGREVFDGTTGAKLLDLPIAGDPDDVWFIGESRVLALVGGEVLLVDGATGDSRVLLRGSRGLPSIRIRGRPLQSWLGP